MIKNSSCRKTKAMAITDQGKSTLPLSEDLFTLAKGTGVSFCGEIGHIIITYVYGIVIARFVGISDFGIFFLGITIFNLVALLSLCGIEDGLMRFLGIYVQNEKVREAKGVIRFSLLLAIGLGILFGSLCFFSADLLAKNLFHKPELATVLRYLSLGIPISAMMTVSVAAIRGFKIVTPYVLVRKIFMPLISFIFALVVFAMGYGLGGLIISYVTSVGFSAALAIFLLASFISPFTQGSNILPERRKYLSFIRSAFFVNILLFSFVWSDLIIVGVFLSPQETGIYFASKKTALILSLLLISLNTIFAPVISHLYSGRKYNHIKHVFKTATQWILILGTPLFLVMLFFSRELLSLFGPDFKAGQMCLIILAIGQLINISAGSVAPILMMTGHQRWMVLNSIIFLILAIPLTLFLVPRYGILGAAYANTSAVIFANLVALAEVYFLLRLHPYNIRYFKVLFLGAITATIAYIMRYCLPNDSSVIFWLIEAAFIFAIFFALVILFGLEENERKILVAIKERLKTSYVHGTFRSK
jgi:O-antigen/teichoic acid export membrane protein